MSNTFPRLGKPAPLFEGDVVRFDSRKKEIFFDTISLNKIIEDKKWTVLFFIQETFQVCALPRFTHLIEESRILKKQTAY